MHDFSERDEVRPAEQSELGRLVQDGLRALSGAELRIEAGQDRAPGGGRHSEGHEHRPAPGWMHECQDVCAAAAEIVAAHRAKAADRPSGASLLQLFPEDGGDNLARYGRYWLPATAVTAAVDGGLLLGAAAPAFWVVLIQSVVVVVLLAPTGLRSVGEVASAVAEGSTRRFWDRLGVSALLLLLALSLMSVPALILWLSGASPDETINWYNVHGRTLSMFDQVLDRVLDVIDHFWKVGGFVLGAVAWMRAKLHHEKAPSPVF